jgi:hypothetical protein
VNLTPLESHSYANIQRILFRMKFYAKIPRGEGVFAAPQKLRCGIALYYDANTTMSPQQ